MSVMLRILGKLCPPVMGLDFRIIGRLHQYNNTDPNSKIRSGNGFFLAGDTSNAGFISGINERPYMKRLGQLIRPGDTIFKRWCECRLCSVVAFKALREARLRHKCRRI
jgi:hypothetical protein